MPLARIITAVRENANVLAGRLEKLGYFVEIVSPNERPGDPADVEVLLESCSTEQALERAIAFTQKGGDAFLSPGVFEPAASAVPKAVLNTGSSAEALAQSPNVKQGEVRITVQTGGHRNAEDDSVRRRLEQAALLRAQAQAEAEREREEATRLQREAEERRLEAERTERERVEAEQRARAQAALEAQAKREREEAERRERERVEAEQLAVARAQEEERLRQAALHARQRDFEEQCRRAEQEKLRQERLRQQQIDQEPHRTAFPPPASAQEHFERRAYDHKALDAAHEYALRAEPAYAQALARKRPTRSLRRRERELVAAGTGAALMALLVMLVWGVAGGRRPANPLDIPELVKSEQVEQTVPFGSATTKAVAEQESAPVANAPVQADTKRPPAPNRPKARPVPRQANEVEGDDEVVIRRFDTAPSPRKDEQERASVRRISDLD